MKRTVILYAIGLVLILRLVYSAVLLIGAVSFPVKYPLQDVNHAEMYSASQNGSLFERTVLLPWLRWDTLHYLEIANTGYTQENQTVWPPLYPAMIALLSSTGMPPLAAALVISTLAAVAVVYSFYMLAVEEQICSPKSALFFLFTFPVCFYLFAGYTEALFLALTLACMRQARRGSLFVAGLMAAMATWTRQTGVLLAIPLFIEGMRRIGFPAQRFSFRRGFPMLEYAAMPFVAFVIFSFYVHQGLGFDFPWNSMKGTWGNIVVFPGWGILEVFKMIINGNYSLNPITMAVDALLVMLACALLIQMIWKRVPMPLSFTAYFIINLLLIMMYMIENQPLASASRYLLVLFPIFLIQARLWTGKWVRFVWFTFFVVSQLFLFGGFYAWLWVG